MSAFEEYGVMPEIIKAVEDLEWLLPTDVQAEAIPLILGGGDVLMAAETGSGKTGAFCLPVLQIVHEATTEAKHLKALKSSGSQTVAAMSVSDRDQAFAIAQDGLLCQSRDKDWQGGRGTTGISKGKYYYESVVSDEGLCRVGWSTITASRNLGTDKQGFGFGGTGKKSFGSAFETYGEPFGRNDTIGCYIDMDAYIIGFSKNGKDLGKAFDIPSHLHRMAFYPACVIKNAEIKFNFGATPFKHPLPGYNAVSACSPEHSSQASQAANLPSKKAPLAVILEPSRELAQQTYEQLILFKKYLTSELNIEVFVGGANAKDQIAELKKGVDIVVGTPGRLDDFITNSKLDLSQVRFLILDEADGLLAQGHKPLIQKIYNAVPKEHANGRRLQMIVCSATLHSNDVKQLAQELLYYPTWIDLKGKDAIPETVHQVQIKVAPNMAISTGSSNNTKFVTDGVHTKDAASIRTNPSSPEALSEQIKKLKPHLLVKVIDAHNMDQAIIFCRTKLDCDHVRDFLQSLGGGARAIVNGYSCVCLHSDVRDRAGALNAFKNGDVRFLLCTDVAARGIDISGLPFVINYTLPETPEDYIHRIGRVGRAERMGLAISLVSTVPEKVWYHSCASRGRDCTDNRLKENGGCTIWYDESEIMRAVQVRTGETVVELTGDYKLATQTSTDGKIVYGEKKLRGGSSDGVEFLNHTAQLAPSVKELEHLEFEAQSVFWTLQTKKW